MSWPMTILLIVVIGAITSTLQTLIGRKGRREAAETLNADVARLMDEVRTLRGRVTVLERIATDKGNLLEQEFRALGDR